ncbi:response regulator [Clostridium sp. HMP27]|uniref:response regulator transcription factor n=1 Tax=Clostridium sp. HMP27 TaxID=1487921 RepID=UPI00052C4A80|nr:response regulator [Clostridium sp. HMP27]KGK89971.1 AraC family transcriptional regulator [Clostridium sp. HMP27]
MYKILVVEDEDIIRKGLIYMVDWLKVNCVIAGEASDGKEGIEKIKEIKPDIVITDIKMPYKDGIEMLEETIFEHEYETIIISGYSEFEYAKKAIKLNVTEYLLKPIDFEYLYETIEKLTEKIQSKNKIKEVMNKFSNMQSSEVLDIGYYEKQTFKTKYVRKMIKFIETKYNCKISLEDLSKEINVSSAYLNTKFKEETSYTFNDFLNRYRILQSIALLKQGNLKIYEIAEEVGFKDYKYFIEVFKKYIGYSPSKFLDINN